MTEQRLKQDWNWRYIIVFFFTQKQSFVNRIQKKAIQIYGSGLIVCSFIIDINPPSIIGNIIEKNFWNLAEERCLDMITILICYMFKRACPKILVDFYTSQNQLKNYLYISCFNDLKTQTIFSVKNKRMKMLMAFQRGTRCWYG